MGKDLIAKLVLSKEEILHIYQGGVLSAGRPQAEAEEENYEPGYQHHEEWHWQRAIPLTE